MMIPIDGKKCSECEAIVCRDELEAWKGLGKTTCPSCSIENAQFKELKPRDLKALNTLPILGCSFEGCAKASTILNYELYITHISTQSTKLWKRFLTHVKLPLIFLSHINSECLETTILCPLKCDSSFTKREAEEHYRHVCKKASIVCEYCGDQTTREAAPREHRPDEESCMYRAFRKLKEEKYTNQGGKFDYHYYKIDRLKYHYDKQALQKCGCVKENTMLKKRLEVVDRFGEEDYMFQKLVETEDALKTAERQKADLQQELLICQQYIGELEDERKGKQQAAAATPQPLGMRQQYPEERKTPAGDAGAAQNGTPQQPYDILSFDQITWGTYKWEKMNTLVIPHPYAVLPSKLKDVEVQFEGETQNGIPHGLCVIRYQQGGREKEKDGTHHKEVFRKLNDDLFSFIAFGTMVNGQMEGPAIFIHKIIKNFVLGL